MRFLVDNALSPALAAGLNARGHEAVHVLDYGLEQASDDVIFDRAVAEERVLISSDSALALLVARRNARRPSVVLFRYPLVRPAVQLALLLANLQAIEEQLRDGCIVVMQPGRMRIRELPFGEWR